MGVETEAGEIAAAAGGVADDRVADGFAVDTELVCATGYGFEFEQRSISHPFADAETCFRLAAVLF